ISFLGQDNMEVNEALASLQPQAGDVIKGQYAFAIYDPVLKWVGNLEFLQPGEGYLIKISTDQQLIYPASGLITGTRSENHSLQKLAADLNPHKYEENMPMVIQVVGLPLEAKDAVLKSYAKDEIRGVAKSFTDEQNRMLFFMTNFGDQNTEKLHFAIEHNGETSEFDELIPFSSEKVSGSFENPVVLNLGEAESGELFGYSYPNPFSDEVNISFAIGQQGRATVKVFAMDGKLILDRDFTGNANESMKFLWDGKSESGNVISSGNYVLQIENGDVSHQELLVKE
ncbi:MAG: T9SS type A sorting domain-containing protein, partial [Bacteroidota bacterium]